jgi:hypothetical protein
MTSIKKIVIISILIICSFYAKGQNTIKYHFHPSNPDSCIVTFIDTVQNEVLRSFSLVEFSPFWNLPYPESDYKEDKSKTFDFSTIKAINNEIPGLVTYESSKNLIPLSGYTYSSIVFSPDNQFVVIPHYLMVFSEDRKFGYATVLHIYNSKGELYKTVESSDVEIITPRITNDGKYLVHGFGIELDDEGLEWSELGYRIIDLEKNVIILERSLGTNRSGVSLTGLYTNNNLIGSTVIEYKNNKPIITISLYNLESNLKFITEVTEEQLNRFKEITIKGILLNGVSKNDTNTVLLRFDTDFKSERIQ